MNYKLEVSKYRCIRVTQVDYYDGGLFLYFFMYLQETCCLVAKSSLTLLRPHGLQPAKLICPWDFQGNNIEVGSHFLQVISSTQRLDLHLLHWQADSLPLSYQGSLFFISWCEIQIWFLEIHYKYFSSHLIHSKSVLSKTFFFFLIIKIWDFPGGPGAKSPSSQGRGLGFDPWSGNQIVHVSTKSSHAMTKRFYIIQQR